MNITFLIVEDVSNFIIGLNALRQNGVQLHLLQSGKVDLQHQSR